MLSLYAIVALGFFIYSFSLVDLNLTLTSNPTGLKIISSLQQIAYFNRPLSAKIYAFLSGIAFLLFLYIVLIKSKKLKKFPWKPIIIISSLFAFAYPFLSHDIFNYLFYARTIVKYHMSPYVAAPNWFPDDEWLRFMRWVHVPTPYGPFHAFIVLPSYILGLGKLTLSLFFIKAINYFFFIVSIKEIGKIGKLLKRTKSEIIGSQLMLSLNPLILIESLANGHNDAVMMAIYLVSLRYLLSSEKVKSIIYLAISAGVKYITAVLAPFYLLTGKLSKEQIVNFQVVILSLLVVGFYLFYGFQVWYATWALYVVPLTRSKPLKGAVTLFTIGGLAYYVPYIFTGLWNQEPVFTKTIMFGVPISFAILSYSYLILKPKLSASSDIIK